MNQRMSGDIQLLQDGGPVDASVNLIRKKSAELDPNDFRAHSESDSIPAEQLDDLMAMLAQKQYVPSSGRCSQYPFA